MARGRAKGILSNQYVVWGLYGVAAYYAYNWWLGRQAINTAQPVALQEPTVSAFPRF